MQRPSKKASARVVYLGGLLFGNLGNWEWVESREWIHCCTRCRVVYPPDRRLMCCPRHHTLSLVPGLEITLTP